MSLTLLKMDAVTTRHLQNSNTAAAYIFVKTCRRFPQSLNANAGIVSLNKPPPLTSNEHFTSPLLRFKWQVFFIQVIFPD